MVIERTPLDYQYDRSVYSTFRLVNTNIVFSIRMYQADRYTAMVNFSEKLKRLLGHRGMTQKHLASTSGLGAAVLSKYVNIPATKPRADIALGIASALHVPLSWLVDDSQDWPPPSPESGAPSLPTAELLDELGRRFCRDAPRLVESLAAIEAIDWDRVARVLAVTPIDAPIPDEIETAMAALLVMREDWRFVIRYDVSIHVLSNHFTPLGPREPNLITFSDARSRLQKVRENMGYSAVEEWLRFRTLSDAAPEHRDTFQQQWSSRDQKTRAPSETAVRSATRDATYNKLTEIVDSVKNVPRVYAQTKKLMAQTGLDKVKRTKNNVTKKK